jgi:lysophospholipase L1-like esterase
VGGTVIPRGRSGAGWTAAQEQHRLAVNAWMRSPAANLDGLVDWDAIMQGPIIPETGAVSIKPEYNCDNTHPNAAGYRAMGEFIDLSLFENQAGWSNGR